MSYRTNSVLILGMTLSVILLAASLILDLDLFEKFSMFIMNYEEYELDEFVFPIFVLLLFAYINESKRRNTLLLDEEKSKIFQATVNASKKVIETFINEVELFKIKAMNTNSFTTEELNIYTNALNEANYQLAALGKINNINEKEIYNSIIENYKNK